MAQLPSQVGVTTNDEGQITRISDTRVAGTGVYDVVSVSDNGEYTVQVVQPGAEAGNVYVTDNMTSPLQPIPSAALATKQTEIGNTVNFERASDVQKKIEADLEFSSDPNRTLQEAAALNGQNIPISGTVEGPSTLSNDVVRQTGTLVETEDYKCYIESLITGEKVEFIVTPSIDESGSAQYDVISPTHHPGNIQVYKTSTSRAININAKLIARNKKEATQNIIWMNLIRSWVKPYYGSGTANHPFSRDRIGAPPDPLIFTCYGRYNLKDIPCVLASYSWSYPDDIDYLPTYPLDGTVISSAGEITTCPRIIDITVTLMENYSPEQFGKFDLIKYKEGKLDEAYSGGNGPEKIKRSNAWKNFVGE